MGDFDSVDNCGLHRHFRAVRLENGRNLHLALFIDGSMVGTKNNPLASEGPDHGGLGGWLVVVALYLVAEIEVFVVIAFKSFSLLYSNLAVPNVYLGAYARSLVGLLIYLGCGASILTIVAMFCLFFFFTKSRRFPLLLLIFAGSSVVFASVAYLLAFSIPISGQGQSSIINWLQQLRAEPVKAATALLLLSVYVKMSRRLRKTFVR